MTVQYLFPFSLLVMRFFSFSFLGLYLALLDRYSEDFRSQSYGVRSPAHPTVMSFLHFQLLVRRAFN